MPLHAVFSAVLNMSITASIAIAVILPARLLLKRAPKIFSYALWAVVLFRLLCPISLTSWFSLMGLVRAPAPQAGRIEYVSLHGFDTEGTATTAAAPPPALDRTSLQGGGPALAEAAPAEGAIDLSASVISAVWLCGVAATAAIPLVQLLRLRRRLTGAIPLKDNIYLADGIPTSFVMGLGHPKIYLPSTISHTEQGYIIQHEKHHIRRGDHIIKLLAFAALCIHWFNPLVWLAFALAGKDMEMSCDEAVIRQTGRDIRADYSSSLLQFSTGKRGGIGRPLSFGEGDTKARIENVMRYKKPTILTVALAVLVCIGLTACLSSNPTSDGEEIDLSSLEERTLRDTLRPYLDAYNLCISDSYGAEVTQEGYWRCYQTEAASQSSYENDPSAIQALIPSGSAIPDGLYVDPAYASCLPVSNYASVEEIRTYFSTWISEDADFFTTGLAASFFEYEDRVYQVTGARGSGAVRIDPESAVLTGRTEEGDCVQVDCYLFDEKETTPVTLVFALRDGKLRIVDAENGLAEDAPPTETQPPAEFGTETAAQPTETPWVILNDESGAFSGRSSDIVALGQRWARITLDFEYEIDGELYKIRDIVGAEAEDWGGWVSVAREVQVDTQNIMFNSSHTKAVVPITYRASIGVGLASYDATVQIDLSAF